MSCSIDRPAFRRGSILMEFVMVLPIYIFLFGALILLGDMGLKAISLAVGDRDAAMDAGDSEGHSFYPFMDRQLTESGILGPFSKTYRADENFNGAWSWQAAGETSFMYKLLEWGPGLVSYPYLLYGGSGGSLGTLVGGGRVEVFSKDRSTVRAYSYYTLKRTDLARSPRAYRNWDSDGYTSESWLTDSSGGKQYWYRGVFEEPYADSSADELDAAPRQSRDTPPDSPSGRKEYIRFPAFVTWSQ